MIRRMMRMRARPILTPVLCLAMCAVAGGVPLAGKPSQGDRDERVAIAPEGQWTDSSDTNRYDLSYDDVPLADVVFDVARIAGVNIVANPEMLRGRVTANLKDVSWRIALEEILCQSDLCVLEEAPDSHVFVVVPMIDPARLRCLVYGPLSETSMTSGTVSFSIQDATWQEVLVAFAREARLNLAYEPVLLTNRPKFDISLQDVRPKQALQEIADICDLRLYLWRQYYLVVPSGAAWPSVGGKEWNSGGQGDGEWSGNLIFRLGLMAVVLPLLIAFLGGLAVGFLLARMQIPRPG